MHKYLREVDSSGTQCFLHASGIFFFIPPSRKVNGRSVRIGESLTASNAARRCGQRGCRFHNPHPHPIPTSDLRPPIHFTPASIACAAPSLRPGARKARILRFCPPWQHSGRRPGAGPIITPTVHGSAGPTASTVFLKNNAQNINAAIRYNSLEHLSRVPPRWSAEYLPKDDIAAVKKTQFLPCQIDQRGSKGRISPFPLLERPL